jgi:steroid 5-alpha reductase family enzyme
MGLLITFLFSLSWMMLCWVFYLFIKRAMIVDLAWTFCVFFISLLYFMLGVSSPSLYIGFIASIIWAAKLVTLLAIRIFKHKSDGRYIKLDELWKDSLKRNYFIFFTFQAVGAWIFMIPFYFISRFPNWGVIEYFATFLTIVGLLGNILSDYQLQSFLFHRKDSSKICEKGLWYYSRHPNYFFEFVYWLGISVFALSSPYGFIALISPLSLLLTLLFFTGIPAAEKQALLSKGESYRLYQEKVSSFIPWFRKK